MCSDPDSSDVDPGSSTAESGSSNVESGSSDVDRDTSEPDDHGSQYLPDCPRCGTPVAIVSATGPNRATASPCGCLVSPGLINRER
ncbi:hypothetical protein [Natrinema longum]|uniref:Small CPxCG-related zinc finger protein n=1 Tax=Natrinema longum TaxID=370324 RepID=A0A8A2UA89_9EURY|nr:hypothetical protein [Natrinema longum]MBZ6496389.1 hypothetical protein [Natrinema longum]QSW85701.1 hypothetical protein J0X27_02335 [Natrinema longum]